MPLPVTALTWSGAALPIVVLVFLLVFRRWPAIRAASAGTVAACAVAAFTYQAPAALLMAETGKGLWNSLSIIAVTIPAILIYELSREIGAFGAIQRDLTRLIPDPLLQVLTLGWCFSSFLQGPSGFGVPIAVTAPLLIGIGVKPFWAVLIPLMAHAWANTFGTLALAWDALLQQTVLGTDPVAAARAAWWTGGLTGLLCLAAGLAICWQYRGWRGLAHGLPALAVLGSIMAGGQLLLCGISPTMSVVIPTCLAMGAAFVLGRLPRYASRQDYASGLFAGERPQTARSTMTMHQALLPYYLLVGISLLVLFTPPLRTLLESWTISPAFPQTLTGLGHVNPAAAAYAPVAWLTHSGFFLLAAALLSAGYYARLGLISRQGAVEILRNTWVKSLPACISVALLLVMSKVMTGSGQITVLAMGVSSLTSGIYPLLGPSVGMLGSFMSSSNVSSNILFGSFQESMARLTGRDPALILAAQTCGAAAGAMFSPSKVLLGTTTAGIAGQEGEVIRKLFALAGTSALVMGILSLCFA